MKIKIQKISLVVVPFLWIFIFWSNAGASVLFSDTFNGTNIDTNKWTELDSQGLGGTVGNVKQNNAITISGVGTIGTNGLVSKGTFDRTLGDIDIEADITSDGCSRFTQYGSFTFNIGYGTDFNYVGNNSNTYLVTINGGRLGVFYYENATAVTSPSGSFSCTDNVPFHVRLKVLQSGGIALYVNNSPSADFSFPNGTFTNGHIFIQSISSGTIKYI